VYRILSLLPLLALLLTTLPAYAEEEQPWLLIDTRAERLVVMEGEQELATFEEISIGRNGTSQNKVQHDQTTPLGRFRITWVAEETPFYRFFGLDYPNRERSDRALRDGLISKQTYRRIRHYQKLGQTPPQRTALGGHIGIHGIGKGDLTIHQQFNWTNGCIALTNEQIKQLEPYIEIGTVVEIR